MKIKIVNSDGRVRVLLGDQELPGVVYVGITADQEETSTLLHLRDVDIMLEVDGQLLDIEVTPLEPL